MSCPPFEAALRTFALGNDLPVAWRCQGGNALLLGTSTIDLQIRGRSMSRNEGALGASSGEGSGHNLIALAHEFANVRSGANSHSKRQQPWQRRRKTRGRKSRSTAAVTALSADGPVVRAPPSSAFLEDETNMGALVTSAARRDGGVAGGCGRRRNGLALPPPRAGSELRADPSRSLAGTSWVPAPTNRMASTVSATSAS